MANRLRFAKSPYLLLHKDNPVDWFPWGAEAFEKAEKEDKPIFLSIGYSACHWCHQMAREAFSDNETAQIINRHFVPIKVDKEERPDVDEVYMKVCQGMTGSGGWPLNLFLTPGRKPFFAGTYFPIEDGGGYTGFKTLLSRTAAAWADRRQTLVDTAGKIADALGREEEGMYTAPISATAAENAVSSLSVAFDRQYGGFGAAPKFPMPQIPLFLLAYARKTENPESRKMAEETLQKIHDGGLYDHVGGGYFRYSTDRAWTIPHYEKMLYDNALLSLAFFEAGGHFISYGEDVLSFLRTLENGEGGFFTAISAESAEGEGAFYLWNREEVTEILGEDGPAFCETYHISKNSLPRLSAPLSADFSAPRKKLVAKRALRPAPPIDEKILTGQNGLAAAAFARGAAVTGKAEYADVARRTLAFIEKNLKREDGRLLARYFAEEGGVLAFSADYVYLLFAFLSLYEATGDTHFLAHAKDTVRQTLHLFALEKGGLTFSGRDGEDLIFRLMEGEDGAMPPANALFPLCLLRLSRLTGESAYKEEAEKIFFAFGGQVNALPSAFCSMLYAKLEAE